MDNSSKIDGGMPVVFRGETPAGALRFPAVVPEAMTMRRFGMAVAASASAARNAAAGAPFYLTDIALPSGQTPSPEALVRWLWSAVAAGASGMELGASTPQDSRVWTLRNIQGGPSSRSVAVDAVCGTLVANRDIFAGAKPLPSPISVLYTRESAPAGGQASALAFYEILTENGLYPEMAEMSEYGWDAPSFKGRCIVIAGQVSVPSRYYPLLREFVKKGGKLVVEGLSFYYDEDMAPAFARPFPLADVMGGVLEDSETFPGLRKLKIGKYKLWASGQCGLVHNEASGESLTFMRNKYGRGTVLWMPSSIALGTVESGHRRRFSKFLLSELSEIVAEMPIRFRRLRKGICMQVLQVPGGLVTVVGSSASHRRKVRMKTSLKVGKQLFMNPVDGHEGRARNRKVKVHAGQTNVAFWKEKVK